MGIVLLKFDVQPHKENLVRNLTNYGVICLKAKGLPYTCFISHDLTSSFWYHIPTTVENEIGYYYKHKNFPVYNLEPTAQFQIIELIQNSWEPMFALIKVPTIAQIKLHARYHINFVKYLLLSKLLYLDVNNMIIDKLFWLEINCVFTCNPQIITNYHVPDHYNKKFIETFQNIINKRPYNWMFL